MHPQGRMMSAYEVLRRHSLLEIPEPDLHHDDVLFYPNRGGTRMSWQGQYLTEDIPLVEVNVGTVRDAPFIVQLHQREWTSSWQP
jgi:hypothetical protein